MFLVRLQSSRLFSPPQREGNPHDWDEKRKGGREGRKGLINTRREKRRVIGTCTRGKRVRGERIKGGRC